MRVLLIATNRHDRLMGRMDARPLPIGLAYVAGHLDPVRHTTKVIDLMFADDYLSEVEAAVNDFKPDLVGLIRREEEQVLRRGWPAYKLPVGPYLKS